MPTIRGVGRWPHGGLLRAAGWAAELKTDGGLDCGRAYFDRHPGRCQLCHSRSWIAPAPWRAWGPGAWTSRLAGAARAGGIQALLPQARSATRSPRLYPRQLPPPAAAGDLAALRCVQLAWCRFLCSEASTEGEEPGPTAHYDPHQRLVRRTCRRHDRAPLVGPGIVHVGLGTRHYV